MELLKYYLNKEFKYTVPLCIFMLASNLWIFENNPIPLWIALLPMYFTITGIVLFCVLAGMTLGLVMSGVLFLTFIGVKV